MAALLTAAVAVAGLGVWWPDGSESQAEPAPRATAWLSIDSDPAGTALWLDGREIGVAPRTLTDIEPGEHRLVAQAEGYLTLEQTVIIERAGEKNHLVLSLKPLARKVAPWALEPAAEREATPVSSSARARGRLTLSATPWAEVYEGNRKLGDTPLVDFPMAAGRHVLRLVNSEAGVDRKVLVEIKPGQQTALKQKL